MKRRNKSTKRNFWNDDILERMRARTDYALPHAPGEKCNCSFFDLDFVPHDGSEIGHVVSGSAAVGADGEYTVRFNYQPEDASEQAQLEEWGRYIVEHISKSGTQH